MGAFWSLFLAIQESSKNLAVDRKVKDDVERIRKAFKEGDTKALNDLFSGNPD